MQSPRRSLQSAFDPRRNSLNALRLLLATLVIVSHSWPIGGYGDDPQINGSKLGAWAVTGFFVVSGYLITASRFSSRNLGDYLWRRFLRIYPAFLASLLLVGLVLAPLSQFLMPSRTFTYWNGIEFIVSNLSLFINNFSVRGTLESAPYWAWNGSLWTLIFEAGCYLMVGLIVTILRTRRNAEIALLVLFSVASAYEARQVTLVGGAQFTSGKQAVAQLVPAFLAGAVLYVLRRRIPASGLLAAVAGALVVGSVFAGVFPAVAPLPAAYLLMWLGVRLPLTRIASRNDISYGMYVYAFPLQQVLVLLGAAALPVAFFVPLAVLVTVPVAWASWKWIEQPAMRLKRLTAARTPDREGHLVVAEAVTGSRIGTGR